MAHTTVATRNEWFVLEPQQGPKPGRCEFTPRGLVMLEELAGAGLTIPQIAEKMRIPGKKDAARVIGRDPHAKRALEKGRALAKMRKQPTYSLIRKQPDGSHEITAAGLATIKDVASRGGRERAVAAALGISQNALKRLLDRDESARAAYEAGFSERDLVILKDLRKQGKTQVVANIFELKTRGFDDRSAQKIEVDNSQNVNILQLPAALSVEQFAAAMAKRSEADRRVESAPRPTQTPALLAGDKPADTMPAWLRGSIETTAEPMPTPLSKPEKHDLNPPVPQVVPMLDPLSHRETVR